MTAPIRTCPAHGPFAADGNEGADDVTGEGCPVCGDRGEKLLSGARRRQLSKYVSGALRHFPADAGLEVDDQGWTRGVALANAVERKYEWADKRHLEAVIDTDPKGRFERASGDCKARDDRVRAAYGHSIDVSLEPTESPIPDTLYHGTVPRNLESILEDGLQPMSRQQVHLSGTRHTARTVGERHTAEPVVLAVDAATMRADGHRITKRGRETYTTDVVPPAYLTVPDR
ncbi:RNA 2'-phosphotransferase [Natronolimnobius sp. AArcel1]|uniref:RNA 2'-phosphotransferase n=1 Tax=Natronolimnobius sp. AArcel1 TaxID=1679093 RepID=UPI0013EC09F0|nr:RNA 2'-phosphotransferase [Natronolimnobius sp. AArcel1]NGM68243.1 RNA 2'-phosphotransferase [Natronolimnobius sp. AArcel1]